jgi:hypothetical protein
MTHKSYPRLKFLLALVSVILLAGCTNKFAKVHAPWKSEEIAGLSLQLIAPIKVQNFRFDAQGYVAVTSGTIFSVTTPEYRWRVTDGKLQIYSESKLIEQLTLIQRTSHRIKAITNSGKIVAYRITNRNKG